MCARRPVVFAPPALHNAPDDMARPTIALASRPSNPVCAETRASARMRAALTAPQCSPRAARRTASQLKRCVYLARRLPASQFAAPWCLRRPRCTTHPTIWRGPLSWVVVGLKKKYDSLVTYLSLAYGNSQVSSSKVVRKQSDINSRTCVRF